MPFVNLIPSVFNPRFLSLMRMCADFFVFAGGDEIIDRKLRRSGDLKKERGKKRFKNSTDIEIFDKDTAMTIISIVFRTCGVWRSFFFVETSRLRIATTLSLYYIIFSFFFTAHGEKIFLKSNDKLCLQRVK